jgi:hypothetical protein
MLYRCNANSFLKVNPRISLSRVVYEASARNERLFKVCALHAGCTSVIFRLARTSYLIVSVYRFPVSTIPFLYLHHCPMDFSPIESTFSVDKPPKLEHEDEMSRDRNLKEQSSDVSGRGISACSVIAIVTIMVQIPYVILGIPAALYPRSRRGVQ